MIFFHSLCALCLLRVHCGSAFYELTTMFTMVYTKITKTFETPPGGGVLFLFPEIRQIVFRCIFELAVPVLTC
jgi:hypothetical protein